MAIRCKRAWRGIVDDRRTSLQPSLDRVQRVEREVHGGAGRRAGEHAAEERTTAESMKRRRRCDGGSIGDWIHG